MEASRMISLPDELITFIVLELPMVDILRCKMLCKHINSLVQTSSAIQYKIELAANCLVSCPASELSAAVALRRLKEQQQAWRHCDWTKAQRIELGVGCRTYELRNGIWAFGHSDLTSDHTLPPDYTTTITCCTLPSGNQWSKLDTFNGVEWTLKNFGLAIRDFTMDPLMDLLVLIEQTPADGECPFRVHIRRLSDGVTHDLASKPVLDVQMASSNRGSCTFGVQLHGPYVGVLVRQDVGAEDLDYLCIWNWRTGSRELHRKSTVFSFDDFAFIDTRTIVLALVRHRDPVELQFWTFDDSQAIFVGSFSLPLTTQPNAYLEIHFDGSPSRSLAGAKTLDGDPFTCTSETDIIAVSFGVVVPDPDAEEPEVAGFTMVMRPSLMLDVLARHPFEDEFQWDAWGPECTRWLPQGMDNVNWEPCSFGGRYAVVGTRKCPQPADEDPIIPEPQVIQLFDFNPHIVARFRDESPSTTCVLPSVVQKETIFVDNIVSSLPYHVAISRELDCRVSGVMIDEGRLVCTKAEIDEEWRTLIVFAF